MRRAGLATLLCVTLLALAPARAEDVADFFRGKTVRIIVGVGVGSGYDLNARLLARFLPNDIPGHPTVIVQNQPGAGSLTMTNQLFIAGPFDGTAIGASFNGMPTTPLFQPAAVHFDANKLIWLGSTNRETQVTYVWHTAPVQSFDELKTKELIVGAQAPGSTQYDFPVLANALFGTKFKVIPGYASTPKIHLAMEARRGAGQRRHQLVDAQAAQLRLDRRRRRSGCWRSGRSRSIPSSPTCRWCSTSPRARPTSRRCGSRWRGSNTAGRSSCRRACRPSG